MGTTPLLAITSITTPPYRSSEAVQKRVPMGSSAAGVDGKRREEQKNRLTWYKNRAVFFRFPKMS
tara:strand:+ start:2086 stop:2280 length:195 start_codon:yes stop_codon:yes gene_type:complete